MTRFDRLVARSGRRFLERWFTSGEVDYCLSQKRPGQHAAARFAAKEAVLKSIRLPVADGEPVPWRDIEVTRTSDGLPGVRLHGTTSTLADAAGLTALHVSLSHDASYATATAVAIGVVPSSS